MLKQILRTSLGENKLLMDHAARSKDLATAPNYNVNTEPVVSARSTRASPSWSTYTGLVTVNRELWVVRVPPTVKPNTATYTIK